MALTGEQIQERGREGVRQAKRWLDATCCAEVRWNNPEQGVNKLQYPKAGGTADPNRPEDWFSFDLGGNLLGEATAGRMFVAEVKRIASPNQGQEYRSFLAKCYRVEVYAPQMFEHYLWVTWTPFLLSTWNDLATETFVAEAVQLPENRVIALGSDSLDPTVAKRVADKLAVVVLSDRQLEWLTLQKNELRWVRKALVDLRSDDE